MVAAGALGALGGFLGNPWVITAATLLLVAAVTALARRRAGCDACCPPTGPPRDTADRDHPHLAADQEGPAPDDAALTRRDPFLALTVIASLVASDHRLRHRAHRHQVRLRQCGHRLRVQKSTEVIIIETRAS
ncbi:hypothetical protein GCM10023080_071450 [Streptomyces pseudoechinosporeus]